MRWQPHLVAAAAAVASLIRARRAYRAGLAARTTGAAPTVSTGDRVRLHVEREGNEHEDAPVFVLVSGFASSIREYDRQREALRERAPLVLFDQRGHGLSPLARQRACAAGAVGSYLAEVVVRTTGDRPVVLVGHSFEGMAVLAFARQRPDLFGTKVVGAALLSTSAGGLLRAELPSLLGHALVRIGAAAIALRWLRLLAPVLGKASVLEWRPVQRRLARRLFGTAPTPGWAEHEMLRLRARTPLGIGAAFYPAMLLHDNDTEPALNAFSSIPTLVLTGLQDATIPPSRSRSIAAEIGATADLVEVPGAGHMVHLTHPGVVNRALIRLVSRVEGADLSPEKGSR